MTSTRSRFAVVAAIAMAASVLVYAPAASATGHESGGQDQDAGVHQPAIDALNSLDIVYGFDMFAGTGCADSDELCPQDPLMRWEMAVWLVRVLDWSDPRAVASSRFDDVSGDDWWTAHVERLADLGIVQGCETDPLRFCPNEPVSRGQTAALLVRAFDLPAADTAGFIDVPPSHALASDIDRLAAARITAGCTAGSARFCPQRNVTRGEMATFLARVRGLVKLPARVEPTPLPADPKLRIGTLDNGLTYYLRYNDSPGDNLDLRLLVNVGAVNETDDVAGIAHFIEHMLFNGTEDYPGNSLGAALRDIGTELGPDLNAYVSHDETAYTLSVNTDPPSNVPVVFHGLSQMAHSATFDPEAVDSERGVVLDEMRLSVETSSGHISREFNRIYTEGTPYEGRDPIGTRASLEAMTADDLRTFYETWYVPSNMAVVAVGDIAVHDLEDLVEKYFGSIPAGEAPPFEPVVVTPDPEPSTHVVTDEEQAYSFISLDMLIPSHDSGTVNGERLITMETLIEVMIYNRLTDAYHRGELSQVDLPDFLSFTYNRALRYYGTNWQGDDLDSAFTDYLSVLLTAQEHGFTDTDLARAAEQFAAFLEFQIDSAATTQDREYAQLYQNHFLEGADISTAEDSVARVFAIIEDLTAADLTEHYRWLMDRSGPVVIAVGPNPESVPTTADLDAAIGAAAASPPPVEEVAVDELLAAPSPVDPVSDAPLELLGKYVGHEWTFANGVRVMFARSDISEGLVHMQARSLGGWSLLEPGARALSPRAVEAVMGSGLGDLTASQLNRLLEERIVAVSPFIGETVEGFSGGAASDDVETLFQWLHLLVTAPQVDEQAFLQAVNLAENRTSLADVDPRWQAWVAYTEARFDPDWHRPVATRDQIESLTPEALLSMYERRLGDVDDLVVAIVGDIDVSEIERFARHYLGTLPAGESDTYADRRPAMPENVVRREVTVDEGESAILELYYEAAGPVTPLGSVVADVLEAGLSERVFLAIREGLGASYTAGASVSSTSAPQPGYASEVFATLDPARFDEVRSAVLAIVDDVAANGLEADEFTQAVAVVASDYSHITNADLLGALTARVHADDDDLLTPTRRQEELGRVSPADVQSLAAALYGEGGRIEIARRP